MDHWRMSATEYRARFDAVVTFSNGGGLRADGFCVDVPGPDVTEQDVASLFIASLNLLMVDSAELHNLGVFAEPHKGTRGGPSDRPTTFKAAGAARPTRCSWLASRSSSTSPDSASYPRPGSGSPQPRSRSQASQASPPAPTRRYPGHDFPAALPDDAARRYRPARNR
jgi:hypothetical protein